MKKLYYYLYYKIYVFTKRIRKNEASIATTIGISYLVLTNIIGVSLMIFDRERNNIEFFKPLYIGIIILGFAINYLIFLKDKKYIEIEKRFKKETNERRILGNILVSLYVILTLLSPFFIKI